MKRKQGMSKIEKWVAGIGLSAAAVCAGGVGFETYKQMTVNDYQHGDTAQVSRDHYDRALGYGLAVITSSAITAAALIGGKRKEEENDNENSRRKGVSLF